MTSAAAKPVMRLRGIGRRYHSGSGTLEVLRGVDLDLVPGRLVGLVGPSGSGKSTLLHIAGLLDRPDAGTVLLEGRDTADLSERGRTEARRAKLGFVYQFHHLLPELNAWENVAVPLMIAGASRREAKQRALGLLDQVGLAARAEHRPPTLSGGEQQRVAIARALANRPAVIVADEPTGNLDPESSRGVFRLFFEAARGQGAAVLAATHNPELTASLDAVFALREGALVPQ